MHVLYSMRAGGYTTSFKEHVRGETQWPVNAQGYTDYINALLFTDIVPNQQLGSPRSTP